MDTSLWKKYTSYEQIDQRLPIITIMGHVDHGKTTLVEQLLKYNKENKDLTSKEAGGISQNIACYKLPYGILVDTPGHEIFSHLRSVLMNVSDIIILVVACDDGIKSQTIDIIKKAPANSQFIVVINKIDKGIKNFSSIYGQLASYGILVEGNGGETLAVPLSAKTGQGIEDLIEAINLQWALTPNNKNDRNGHAIGYIMDCSLQQGLGYVTSILIKSGTLNQGDEIVADGEVYRIKLIHENKKPIKSCSADQVINVIGITKPVIPGTLFCSVKNKALIPDLIQQSDTKIEETNLESTESFILQTNSVVRLETLVSAFKSKGKIIEACVSNIIKQTTIDVIKNTNAKLILWGDYDDKVLKPLVQQSIKFYASDIIYRLLESLEEPKEPEEVIEILGNARLKKVFVINGTRIAGCGVVEGKISLGNKCLIKRNGTEMAKGSIVSMKREKENIREAAKNTECGLVIKIDQVIDKAYETFLEGDEIVAFKTRLK